MSRCKAWFPVSAAGGFGSEILYGAVNRPVEPSDRTDLNKK